MGKGQIFIIIAVITIVVIVLLKTSLNLTGILEDKRFLELGLERLEFQNLRSELTKVVQVSYNQTNISDNMNDFVRFSKDSFSSRSNILTGIVLTATFPNITQNVDMPLNVTVMNYLDEDLASLNLTFNNTKLSFASVGKSSAFTTSFTFRTLSDINYSLIMNYTGSSVNSTENITIPVQIGTTKLVGFFDMRISSGRLEQRDKFTETVVLNVTRKV